MDDLNCLDRVFKRIETIEKSGCSRGELQESEIQNIRESITRLETIAQKMADKFEATMKAIDTKYLVGLLLIVLIAFMAGINVGEILKGWVIKSGTGLP